MKCAFCDNEYRDSGVEANLFNNKITQKIYKFCTMDCYFQANPEPLESPKNSVKSKDQISNQTKIAS